MEEVREDQQEERCNTSLDNRIDLEIEVRNF